MGRSLGWGGLPGCEVWAFGTMEQRKQKDSGKQRA